MPESLRDHFARLNRQGSVTVRRGPEVGQTAGSERADIEMVRTPRPAQ